MNFIGFDGIIRRLWKVDAPTYVDHLLRLDPASRRNRFGGSVSGSYIRHHAQTAFEAANVIYGFFVDGSLRGVAELRPFDRGEGRAEAAFSIEKAWQSHGVGTELLDRVLLAARNRGIKQLHVTCLVENRRMQQLARKFDAELRHERDCVIGEVEPPYPTPLSLMREVVADSAGLATAVLDAQSRLLKRA